MNRKTIADPDLQRTEATRSAVFRRSKSTRGFTLIEIMIALFILITALLGMISTTVMIVKSNSFGKSMTTATTLAKDKLEQVKYSNCGTLVSPDYATKDCVVQTGSTGTMYTRTLTGCGADSPAAGMKTVQVSVVWNWNNASHTVSLSTVVAK